MITKIKEMVIALLAVITFVVIGAAVAHSLIESVCRPINAPLVEEDEDNYEWAQFNADAYEEYADEFTALFNSYDVKQAKNGAMMLKRAGENTYKFCKKG